MERETAVARKRVEDAETAIKQKQEDMSNVEKAGLTTRDPEKTFEEMLNAIGDSLSDLVSSNDEEDVDDEEDDEGTEQGKQSEVDEPGRVMGTISKTVQRRMERCWHNQMKLDELTHPGWGDMADNFGERDTKYGTTKSIVPAVVKSQTDQVAAAPPPTPSVELIETLDNLPRRSRMLQHHQKVKLVSENGPQAPILLHTFHKQSERLNCNLPPCFEAFNDVIVSSGHLKTCLVF